MKAERGIYKFLEGIQSAHVDYTGDTVTFKHPRTTVQYYNIGNTVDPSRNPELPPPKNKKTAKTGRTHNGNGTSTAPARGLPNLASAEPTSSGTPTAGPQEGLLTAPPPESPAVLSSLRASSGRNWIVYIQYSSTSQTDKPGECFFRWQDRDGQVKPPITLGHRRIDGERHYSILLYGRPFLRPRVA